MHQKHFRSLDHTSFVVIELVFFFRRAVAAVIGMPVSVVVVVVFKS